MSCLARKPPTQRNALRMRNQHCSEWSSAISVVAVLLTTVYMARLPVRGSHRNPWAKNLEHKLPLVPMAVKIAMLMPAA